MRRQHLALFACSFLFIRLCSGVSDDNELARRLVGEWQGGRHAEQYLADGTFRLDPAQGTTHGIWRISNGQLTKTYQLTDPPGEKTFSYQIIALDSKRMALRDERGTEFKSTRMAGPLPAN